MEIYELTHVFFRYAGKVVHSPKSLGFFYSCYNAKQAVQYYSTQPGFRENKDAFSIKARQVTGKIVNDTIFEVVVYLHTEDYDFEVEIELGLYGDEITAQSKLHRYCYDNLPLLSIPNLVVEKIVNRCVVEKKEWIEGFSIS